MAKPASTGSIDTTISDLVKSRGSALAAAPATTSTQHVLIDEITPSPFQPPGRRSPSDESVLPLADDLVVRKQLMNIVVRPLPAGGYELMAGERRWRAFHLNRGRAAPDRRAEWNTIRAEVRAATDAEAADIVAAENLQREQLTPLDEAFTYAQLMVLRNFTLAKQLADHLNKPVRTIQRLLQLHRAPDFIKEAMTKGALIEERPGDEGSRSHRKLDQELALFFLRHFNELAKETVPDLAGDVHLAAAEEASAQTARAAASDLSSREAAERRIEKARAAKERAQKRLDVEVVKRATSRTKAAIERALRENWSLRRAEALFDRAPPADQSGENTTTPAAPRKTRAPRAPSGLFAELGDQLVINRDQVATAPRDQRAKLEVLLETLIEALGAAPSQKTQKSASTPAPSDPPESQLPDPGGVRAAGGINGSPPGSAATTPPPGAPGRNH